MSSRRLRTSLLCLLMLVLPMQALASAIMPQCLAAQARGEQAMEQKEPSHQGHAAHSATAAEHDGDHHAADGLHVGCPLCAGSCHARGALSSLHLNILFIPQAEPAHKAYESFNGYIADTPRRPPRRATL